MFAYRHFVVIRWLCDRLRAWGVFHWSVSGVENLPPAGTPFVMVVNHIRWHDMLTIAGTIPTHAHPPLVGQSRIIYAGE